MLTRVSFADDDGGSGEYEVPLNPYDVDGFEPSRTLEIVEHNLIDGFSVEVSSRQDTHQRVLRWKYRSDQTVYATMYTTLKGYEFTGSNYKYYQDGTIGFINTWTKMKVLSVTRRVIPATYSNAVMYGLVLLMELG